ncbi:hypothetical protein TNCV_1577671 [Trichonephila clavipes]|nr:hypothetical protein TNCV_1577671 [Trichonephila clavipes]
MVVARVRRLPQSNRCFLHEHRLVMPLLCSYHEFPPDLFTHTQRARGAVIIHIAVIIYMFYAVAVVCDDYFVASLEECCSTVDGLSMNYPWKLVSFIKQCTDIEEMS